MKTNNSTILVVCHKPADVYDEGIYTPIQVGKALSNIDLGYIGDDTGDNISNKNPYYCELTAQYWAWKNLQCRNVGLCHYRRYFEDIFTEERLDDIFNNYDVILPRPFVHSVRGGSILHKLITILTIEDVAIFLLVIKKLYPEYEQAVVDYMKGNLDIPYNMFVAPKNLFDKFSEWQFSILFECEKYVRLSGYSRLRRLFGYFAECLWGIYCLHNKLKIFFVPLVGTLDSRYRSKIHDMVTCSLYHCFNPTNYSTIDQLVGGSINLLKNDSIYDAILSQK